MTTPTTHWWKATLLILAVSGTFAGAGWIALTEPPKETSPQVASQPRWVVTSTRAS